VSEPFVPPKRLLLGAGPSQVPDPILAALAQPTVGHFDPAFLELAEVVSRRIRETFRSSGEVALALPTTGSGGAAVLANNFVFPGDRVVCAVIGVFGERLAEALSRAGAEVVTVEAEWGRAVEPERLIAEIDSSTRLVAVVHGETSTGVAQPMDGLADAAHDAGALLVADCVTSLGGFPVLIDEWGVDAAFSGTQKCLNCPPGLSPFVAGQRALERLAERERTPSWYLDLGLLHGYWNPQSRSYHHTAPVNMIYALAEALRLIEEEGLEPRWARHEAAHTALRAGVEAWGMSVLAEPGEALWPLTAIVVPDGVDEAAVRRHLLEDRGIEISGGLGRLAGAIWRVGLMGANATLEVVELVLTSLSEALAAQGHGVSLDEALSQARSSEKGLDFGSRTP